MKLLRSRIQFRNLFILAIAAGMGFVYPIHVIVDHSELFDNHSHHDDHHSGDMELDELCTFCLSQNFMGASEAAESNFDRGEVTDDAFKIEVPEDLIYTGKFARAPPLTF